VPRRPDPIDDAGLPALVQTIVRLREERGWTVNDLARAADVAPATLVSLEDRTNEPRWGRCGGSRAQWTLSWRTCLVRPNTLRERVQVVTAEALLAGAQLLTFGAECLPPAQRLAEEMHRGPRGFLIENVVDWPSSAQLSESRSAGRREK